MLVFIETDRVGQSRAISSPLHFLRPSCGCKEGNIESSSFIATELGMQGGQYRAHSDRIFECESATELGVQGGFWRGGW